MTFGSASISAKTRSAALEKALPREKKLDKELTELELLVKQEEKPEEKTEEKK